MVEEGLGVSSRCKRRGGLCRLVKMVNEEVLGRQNVTRRGRHLGVDQGIRSGVGEYGSITLLRIDQRPKKRGIKKERYEILDSDIILQREIR